MWSAARCDLYHSLSCDASQVILNGRASKRPRLEATEDSRSLAPDENLNATSGSGIGSSTLCPDPTTGSPPINHLLNHPQEVSESTQSDTAALPPRMSPPMAEPIIPAAVTNAPPIRLDDTCTSSINHLLNHQSHGVTEPTQPDTAARPPPMPEPITQAPTPVTSAPSLPLEETPSINHLLNHQSQGVSTPTQPDTAPRPAPMPEPTTQAQATNDHTTQPTQGTNDHTAQPAPTNQTIPGIEPIVVLPQNAHEEAQHTKIESSCRVLISVKCKKSKSCIRCKSTAIQTRYRAAIFFDGTCVLRARGSTATTMGSFQCILCDPKCQSPNSVAQSGMGDMWLHAEGRDHFGLMLQRHHKLLTGDELKAAHKAWMHSMGFLTKAEATARRRALQKCGSGGPVAAATTMPASASPMESLLPSAATAVLHNAPNVQPAPQSVPARLASAFASMSGSKTRLYTEEALPHARGIPRCDDHHPNKDLVGCFVQSLVPSFQGPCTKCFIQVQRVRIPICEDAFNKQSVV